MYSGYKVIGDWPNGLVHYINNPNAKESKHDPSTYVRANYYEHNTFGDGTTREGIVVYNTYYKGYTKHTFRTKKNVKIYGWVK